MMIVIFVYRFQRTAVAWLMKKRHVIKLAPWVEQAVAEWCRDNRMSFQQAVSYLLECELNGRGYLRKDFEPGIVDYPLDE